MMIFSFNTSRVATLSGIEIFERPRCKHFSQQIVTPMSLPYLIVELASFQPRPLHSKRSLQSDATLGDQWLSEIRDLLGTFPGNRILICDETQWHVYANGLGTLTPAGADGVASRIIGSEKDSFTALCPITASREKLSIMLIAKGKMTRAEENQVGDIPPHLRAHSESG
jgi:hypothetical protein